MKKRCLIMALCMLLTAGASLAEVNADFAAYEDYGRVLSATVLDEGAIIIAEGYYGYHMEENPSMTINVVIGKDGVIKAATVVSSKAQTAGFDAMITPEYMMETYRGQLAEPTLETDAVSGATATSQAARYAVQTAAYYAKNALGYTADTNAENKAALSAAFPAAYETFESAYAPDSKKVGKVLYAARGETQDGQAVLGMIVKSALAFSYKGSAGTGWTASEPGAFTMAIVVDCAQNKVCAWNILTDGTKRSEFFRVPKEKIDLYQTVAITDETVFNDFMDGLVVGLEYETEKSEDGPVIAGTSIVYTGATEQGSFSSQLVRNCFRTAAAFYVNTRE